MQGERQTLGKQGRVQSSFLEKMMFRLREPDLRSREKGSDPTGSPSDTWSTGFSGRLGYEKETSWNSTRPSSQGGARIPGWGRFGLRSRKESRPPRVTSPARICCTPQFRISTCMPKAITWTGERSRRHHSCLHRSRASL
uniref:Uncharacterized protein n=1 Tax=Mus spicilegus TaxID=10103 RepID=A0A8C6MU94_MUSSI